MIRSFLHKGLKELFETGKTARIQKTLQKRCIRRLDALDQAGSPEDMNLSGFNFNPLRGRPVRYTVHINGWCITFEFGKAMPCGLTWSNITRGGRPPRAMRPRR
jgi:proteic killer suppression protein